MKIVSYNVNGIRASVKLGLLDWLKDYNADIYCIQEVRCNEPLTKELIFGEKEQISLFETNQNNLSSYYATYNCGLKAGYAGTLILSKVQPDKIILDMDEFWNDDEGRTTTIICGKNAIVDAYIPNGNSRLEVKMQYLSALTKYLKKLKENYNVICVGDFNIAHNEIDLTNPKECKNKSVFLPIERTAFGEILSLGFTDCYRFINPTKVEYTWRSYRSRYDESYSGWKYRIDYILASNSLNSKLAECNILELPYSDHLPVVLNLKD
ncbi:MAG: exodeoxyribonuclease III [Clostridia bacterium]|nr:exodeoxyribonuclease III [Clostridia bacterium]